MKLFRAGCGAAFLTVVGAIAFIFGIAALSVGKMGYGLFGVIFGVVMLVAALL